MSTSVAIVGYAVEGRAALAYYQGHGARVTVCDQSPDAPVPDGVDRQLGVDYLHDLDRFDVIVRSAGIPPEVLTAANPGIEPKITTVVDEFLRVCPTRNVVGVTGTKGKGTTSSLILAMLRAAGRDAHLGGNIGLPPFDFLDELTEESYVVLELSSFQLADIRHAPPVGVCLMVVPEHLNWHADLDDYVGAKANLFAHQGEGDVAIHLGAEHLAPEQRHMAERSARVVSASPGQRVPYFATPGAYVDVSGPGAGRIVVEDHDVCGVDELRLLGAHNWQNACAALTAFWQLVVERSEEIAAYAEGPGGDLVTRVLRSATSAAVVAAAREALTSFTGLEHHIELVREVGGVEYYNDSFGTTPETAIVAIEAFDQPKVVILGGSDKGIPFDGLARTVATSDVREVVVIGNTAEMIENALRAEGFTAISHGGQTIEEIVATARKAAQPGDVVLLSPACASFGMFPNYKERGTRFKAAVHAL